MMRSRPSLKTDPDAVTAVFRDLTGADEASVAAASDGAEPRARRLLEAALAGLWRGGAAIAPGDLTLAEGDGLLADLYERLYAPRLPCRASCTACGARFEFTLNLPDLRAQLDDRPRLAPDRTLRAPSGRRFRLPRLGDLDRLATEGPEDWLRSFLVEGPFEAEALENEIAVASPVLSQDFAAPCPDCGAANRVRFDMASFLVETLAGEAPLLWREVHLVARAYGWGLAEILSLTRPVRRQLAGLIVAEAAPARLRVAS